MAGGGSGFEPAAALFPFTASRPGEIGDFVIGFPLRIDTVFLCLQMYGDM